MGTQADREPQVVVSRDGVPIAVWRSGEGRPLLLVHGTTADHSRWAPVLPMFEAHFSVLTMDRRGRGRSGDAEAYELESEFDDVVAVIESAGGDVCVLGHSYGGLCAIEAALRTDGIAKLVLYEPPMGFIASPPPVVQRLDELLKAGEHDEVVAYFMQEVAGLPTEQVELLRALPAWDARVAAAGTIPREERANREYVFEADRFRDLQVPTLFLQGSDSPEPFAKAAAAVERALPDCRVVVMPGQRHAAMDTATELFTTEVLRFLEAP
jgi:pimeloyl-ACP methyl ester carboxylesterase